MTKFTQNLLIFTSMFIFAMGILLSFVGVYVPALALLIFGVVNQFATAVFISRFGDSDEIPRGDRKENIVEISISAIAIVVYIVFQTPAVLFFTLVGSGLLARRKWKRGNVGQL